MITSQELLKQGYRFFEDKTKGKAHKSLYEKRVTDDKGVKYFIHINHHDLSLINIKDQKESFEISMDLHLPYDNNLSLTLHSRDYHTISLIEKWCENTYLALDAEYTEKF